MSTFEGRSGSSSWRRRHDFYLAVEGYAMLPAISEPLRVECNPILQFLCPIVHYARQSCAVHDTSCRQKMTDHRYVARAGREAQPPGECYFSAHSVCTQGGEQQTQDGSDGGATGGSDGSTASCNSFFTRLSLDQRPRCSCHR